MGIVYSGNVKKLLGLTHPAAAVGVTQILTPAPNTSWVGQGQSGQLASANSVLAIGYLNYGPLAVSGPQQFNGKVSFYEMDSAGTVALYLDTIDPTIGNGSSRWVPQDISWASDGKHVAITWLCNTTSSLSGTYIYSYDGTSFTQIVSYLTGGYNKTIWHSNNATFAISNNSGITVYDVTTSSNSALSGIQSPINSTVAWLGNDLIFGYYDGFHGYALRWSVFTKSFSGITMTSTKTGFVLNSNIVAPTVIAASSSRLIVVNSGTGNMVYDFSYSGSGNFTPKASPSTAASALSMTYATYSSAAKRLICGNNSETHIFNDASGTLTAVSSGVFKATQNVIGVTHDTVSSNVIVQGEYDVTTYRVPASGYTAQAAKQTANSTVFSWDFNNATGSTNFAPTINTNQDAQTISVLGSPAFQPAPGKSGSYAVKFTSAGNDVLAWPKARDFQFMYGKFTMEFYIYWSSGLGYVIGDGNNFFFSASTSFGGGAYFRVKYYNANITNLAINTNTWTHVAITYNGSSTPSASSATLNAYINGINHGATSLSQLNTTDYPFYPNNLQWGYLSMGGLVNYADGTLPTTKNGFAGYLHQVKFSNFLKYTGTFTPPGF